MPEPAERFLDSALDTFPDLNDAERFFTLSGDGTDAQSSTEDELTYAAFNELTINGEQIAVGDQISVSLTRRNRMGESVGRQHVIAPVTALEFCLSTGNVALKVPLGNDWRFTTDELGEVPEYVRDIFNARPDKDAVSVFDRKGSDWNLEYDYKVYWNSETPDKYQTVKDAFEQVFDTTECMVRGELGIEMQFNRGVPAEAVDAVTAIVDQLDGLEVAEASRSTPSVRVQTHEDATNSGAWPPENTTISPDFDCEYGGDATPTAQDR